MVESNFGQELRRLRGGAGWSLRRLARQVHYDPGYLSKVENGVKKPTAELAAACDRALGTGSALAGLVAPARAISRTPGSSMSEQRQQAAGIYLANGAFDQRTSHNNAMDIAARDVGVDDMNRREFLRLLNTAGTLVAMTPVENNLDWERMDYFTDRASRLDPVTITEYAELNSHLWRIFALSSPKDVTLHLVRKQLDVLTSSLHQSHGAAIHQRLCALTGDLFQLAGEIFFDGNRYTEAAHCYTLAATASKEASAFDLWACALTRHAFISVYERQFDKAAPMLELAVGLAYKGDSALSTRHWVRAVQAHALAGLGELDACQRAINIAEQIHKMNGQVHNGGWLRFDHSRLAEERGACYVELRRPDLAEAALTDALSQILPMRRRGCVLTDLAMIGVQRRDPDQLSTYADAALNLARQTKSGVIGRRLQDLQPHLAPFLGNNHIRHLNEQITTLIRHSAP